MTTPAPASTTTAPTSAAGTTTTTSPTSPPLRRHLLAALGLAALSLLLFARTTWHDFVNFDDFDYVVHNPRTLQGLTLDNVRWAFTTLKLVNWHPLTWLSHMADVSLYGLWPGGHHLTSVVWHAANAGLLYLVLVSLTGSAGRSLLVAALFAVHPLRMESVAWVSERKDLLSGFFFILTIGLYARYARTRSLGWYALTAVALALGLMSKAMLVTAPCVLILLDFWPLDRVRRGQIVRLVLEKVPFFAMSAGISAITYYAQSHGGAVGEERNYPLAIRLANAVWSYGRYLRKTVWPNDLAIFYPYVGLAPDSPFPWGKAAISAVILLALTAFAIVMWRRGQRAVLVGWLWFLGMLVPTIGLVQVGSQALADRYTYLPHIGLFVALVWGVAALLENRPAARAVATRGAAVAVLALALTTAWQLRYWRDTETLFLRAVDVTQRNDRAHVALAIYYGRQGRPDLAAQHYRLALAIRPNNSEANNNYGLMLAEADRADEAVEHLERALRAQPRYAEAHNNLANLLVARGEIDRALRHHEAAIRLDPELPQARFNYGMTLAGIGRLRDAQAQLERALQLKPDHADARYLYGHVMAGLGYEVAATGQLREANFLRRDWPEALRSLAWLLATSPDAKVRDGGQAVVVAERAAQLTAYENPVILDTLAAAYAQAGRFDSAVATAARAEQLARSGDRQDLADRFARRLALYRSGKPFVRPAAGTTTQPFEP